MKVTPDNLEAIKSKFAEKEIRPDDSKVVIAEMQINAIKALADGDNRIFSQISDIERWDVSRCLTFWKSPLPSISKRLATIGIDESFESKVVPMLIDEHLSLGHLVGRGRVSEYIEALKAVAQKTYMNNDDSPKRSLLNRII